MWLGDVACLFKIFIAETLKKWIKKLCGIGIELEKFILYTLQYAEDQFVISKDDKEYMVRQNRTEWQNGKLFKKMP